MHPWTLLLDARIGLAAVLVIAGPFVDLPAVAKLRARSTPAGRLKFYRTITASLIVLGLLSFSLMNGDGVQRLLLTGTHSGVFGVWWFRVSVGVLMGGFFCLALLPGVNLLLNSRKRAAYSKAVAKSGLEFLLPRGSQERRWWFGMSLAAGVFEEVMFRGFLLQTARTDLRLGLMLALVLTSVSFGLNHLYQGLAGIVKAALTGFAIGIVAVLTGGLILPMVLHALIDMQMLLMYRPEPEEAAV